MRVAIVAGPYVPVPPKKYGGTERVIEYIIKGLNELGHTPVLFGPGDSEIDCEIVPICEKALYFPIEESEYEKSKIQVQLAKEKTKEELKRHLSNIDIIHSQGFDLIDFQNFPNLTTLHDRVDLDNVDFFQQRKGLYYASISKNQQESFPDLQYVGAIYNGLDPSPFPFVEQPQDYLCFLGRFDRDKNPHLAIQLAIKLNMKLKMAGKIDFVGNTYFNEEIKPYLDHPLIEYLGEIGLEEKAYLLGNAKCNLHPTGFREPFGLTVLEAAYCGTPTMAIDRGSMPELIEDKRTGLLVEDFVQGFHRINDLFVMDRHYISERAKLLFNYKIMAKQYVIAYETVLEIFKQKQLESSHLQTFLVDLKDQLSSFWNSATKSE